MECRVEFDYVAQEPDELTIKKGDIIKNVQTKMDGWFEGTLRGKTGVFPDNFVKLVEKPNPEPKPSEIVVLRNNPSSARRVKVLFSYSPEQDDELPLEVGDILEFIEEVEEGWWRGKLKGREGIFPSNFVEEIEEPRTNGGFDGHVKAPELPKPKDAPRNSLTKGIPVPDVVPATPPSNQSIEEEPAPELPPKPVRELARCFYPYTALNEDELTLAEGDIITIISRQCEDEGWWRGELRGKIGLFPDNFVKIITPGEAQSGGGSVTGPHVKMLAQERNVVPQSDFSAKSKRDSTGGSVTMVDGGALSRTHSTGESKIEQAKAKLNKTNSKESQPQIPIITPKVGHVATSPISPGIAAFHSNLFSNQQKPPDAFSKSKDPIPVPRDEKVSDESEDFNSVERTETLNHLTATRAKAPKRRPPSTIITRENDGSLLNGSTNSYENSLPDSPPHHFSTPMNHSGATNGTMSGSFDGGSSLNHSGSFLSNTSRADNKEGSPTPSSANSSGVSASKPKKQTLPWMAELKQKQDKKSSLVSPGAPSTGSPSMPAASAVTTTNSTAASASSQPQPVAKEPAKAPPLPAKPSSLSTTLSSPSVHEKPTNNNLNHVSPASNTTSSAASSYKPFASKKSPSPAPMMTNHNHNATTNSPMISTSVDNSGHQVHRGDGENSNSTSNKTYVTFEEHQALKTRVTSLENEVETLKRQLKLLLDRDLRGHIV